MTGSIDGRTQLSRITIGRLEDLGYTVDYSKADFFGPDDVNPQCLCNERRTLFEGKHGEVTQLNHPVGKAPRRLSQESRQMALDAGAEILEMQHRKFIDEVNGIAADAVEFVADKIVTIIFEDDAGDTFAMVVERGQQ